MNEIEVQIEFTNGRIHKEKTTIEDFIRFKTDHLYDDRIEDIKRL